MDRCKMKVASTEVKTEVKTINKINGVSSLTREEIKSCHSILTSKSLNRLEITRQIAISELERQMSTESHNLTRAGIATETSTWVGKPKL